LDWDETLANLHAAPFTIARPARQSVAFVFASPHSGRLYPHSFIAHSRLTSLSLRRSEDAFVDELFSGVTELGAPLIAARFPRAYLDVNRAAAEIDVAMFEGALPLSPDSTPRVAAGLGVIPRIVRDGAEIYRGKLAAAEIAERLTHLYRPYHAALAQLIDETRARFGTCVLIDCHSMPSAAAVPDIVLGDRYGISASAALMREAEHAFASHGFSVVRNAPYAGGYTTYLHGKSDGPVQALQIEINRGLYLDEERVMRSPRFGDIAMRLARALRDLTAFAEPTRIAAE
jgi:N-formylglutamate amidohydrolase